MYSSFKLNWNKAYFLKHILDLTITKQIAFRLYKAFTGFANKS